MCACIYVHTGYTRQRRRRRWRSRVYSHGILFARLCVSTTRRQHTSVAPDVRMKLCSTARTPAHAQISPRGGSVWPSSKLVLPFRVPTRLARISLQPPWSISPVHDVVLYASSLGIAYSHRYCGFTTAGNIFDLFAESSQLNQISLFVSLLLRKRYVIFFGTGYNSVLHVCTRR